MLSSICVGYNDREISKRFYDAVLPIIGIPLQHEYPNTLCYAPEPTGGGEFWVLKPYNGEVATFGNGTSIGLHVKKRALVDAFYQAALANGGTDEGAPGSRPNYHPDFYGAYVRDPVGNKILCACHLPE